MAEQGPEASGGWAYLSLVSALPGPPMDPRVALGVQFALFEGTAIVLAARYDAWRALPLATAAIAIAALGSGLMVALSDRLRALSPPEPYRRILFDSSIDVVMGLAAFVALVTYLLVDDRGPGPGLLVRLLGDPLPAPAVYFGLFVAWDLSYRIGTGWWASVTGLWRAVAFGSGVDEAARRAYVRTDLLTIAFAGLQLVLVPFLRADRLLAVIVLGHVVVVVVVSSLAIVVQRRR